MKPIMNVNLKLLQVFVLVAEHASFRAAASDANRSQSSISTQIKQLEGQLGVALFHRTTRSVRLTGEGEQLLDSVRRALVEVETGLRKIAESVDLRRGQVSFACSPTIASTRLPLVLAAFSHDYPDVRLFVRELTASDLCECIKRREVDFGIGPTRDDAELSCRPILTEELYALVPRRLHETLRPSIRLAELVKMPLLLLNPATALRVQIEEAIRARGLQISANYQFTQTQTIIAAASAGLGAAILPKIALPAQPEPELQMLRIIEPTMTREIAIITLRGQTLTPAAARLASLVPRLLDQRPARQAMRVITKTKQSRR
jgi:DNA-binding transcriptional LysR family regulator